jgi:hypothetical protein
MDVPLDIDVYYLVAETGQKVAARIYTALG